MNPIQGKKHAADSAKVQYDPRCPWLLNLSHSNRE